MNINTLVILVAVVLFTGAGCTTTTINVETAPAGETNSSEYTSESWKDVIAPTCQTFFDGCNHCNRMGEDNLAACTKMACATYERPECTDLQEEASANNQATVPAVQPSLASISDFSVLASIETEQQVVLQGTYNNSSIVDDAGNIITLQIQEDTRFLDYPIHNLDERKQEVMKEVEAELVWFGLLASFEEGYVSDGDEVRIVGMYKNSLNHNPSDPIRPGVIVQSFERISGTIALTLPETKDGIVAIPVSSPNRTISVGGLVLLQIPKHCNDTDRSGTTYITCPSPANETPLPEFTITVEGTQVTMRRWEGLESSIWDAAVASLKIVAPLELGVQIDIDR